MKRTFFPFGNIEYNIQGRLEVAIISFIRIRSEAELIHHYRPCAEYEMKVARCGDVLALIRNSITRTGFSEGESPRDGREISGL